VNAKYFLKQVQKLDGLIENKRAERDYWLSLATSTTAGAAPETGVRVQSSGSKQQMADAVDRSVDIGTELDKDLARLFEARRQIIRVIEQLPTMEYELLHTMYVGKVILDKKTGQSRIIYKSLKEAAEDAEKSESWARGVHGRALLNVQRIIDAERMEPVSAMMKRWNAEKCEKV